MNRDVFNNKVQNGKIMIGGLGNPQGVRIMRITKNLVYFKK